MARSVNGNSKRGRPKSTKKGDMRCERATVTAPASALASGVDPNPPGRGGFVLAGSFHAPDGAAAITALFGVLRLTTATTASEAYRKHIVCSKQGVTSHFRVVTGKV